MIRLVCRLLERLAFACLSSYQRSSILMDQQKTGTSFHEQRNASFMSNTTSGRIFEWDHLTLLLRLGLQSIAYAECFNILMISLMLAPAIQRSSASSFTSSSWIHRKKLLEKYCISAYSMVDEFPCVIEPVAFARALRFFMEELLSIAELQLQQQQQQQQFQLQQQQQQQEQLQQQQPPPPPPAPQQPQTRTGIYPHTSAAATQWSPLKQPGVDVDAEVGAGVAKSGDLGDDNNLNTTEGPHTDTDLAFNPSISAAVASLPTPTTLPASLSAAVMMMLAKLIQKVRIVQYRGHKDSLANPCWLLTEDTTISNSAASKMSFNTLVDTARAMRLKEIRQKKPTFAMYQRQVDYFSPLWRVGCPGRVFTTLMLCLSSADLPTRMGAMRVISTLCSLHPSHVEMFGFCVVKNSRQVMTHPIIRSLAHTINRPLTHPKTDYWHTLSIDH